MQEEIGTMAGRIWHALDEKGEMTLPKLKKEVSGQAPVFDWAIGWLARENKITIAPEKRSFLIYLNERHVQSATAA